jgi:hypothetical protein
MAENAGGKRCSYFSASEKVFLCRLVKIHKDVVENKKTDAVVAKIYIFHIIFCNLI